MWALGSFVLFQCGIVLLKTIQGVSRKFSLSSHMKSFDVKVFNIPKFDKYIDYVSNLIIILVAGAEAFVSWIRSQSASAKCIIGGIFFLALCQVLLAFNFKVILELSADFAFLSLSFAIIFKLKDILFAKERKP